MLRNVLLALAASLMIVTAPAAAGSPAEPGSPAVGGAKLQAGVSRAFMNPAVEPESDFFEYANGAWLRDTAIPPDRSRYGVDTAMAERALEQQRALLEAAGRARDADVVKAADLYASVMDEGAIERAGLKPLRESLGLVEAIRSRTDLVRAFARLDRLAVPTPIASFIDPDAKDARRYAFWLYGDGLGLPDRTYYLDPKHAVVRARYRDHIEASLRRLGQPAAADAAGAVLALETQLARVRWSREDARDPVKTYNPRTQAELSLTAPGVDWPAYLQAQALRASHPVLIARQPDYLAGVGRLIETVPLHVWKSYLRVRLLATAAPYLPDQIADAQFAFDQGILQGAASPPERWKRAVGVVDRLMGDTSGRLYVERHFPPETERRVAALVDNLLRAYAGGIAASGWMSLETRAEATAKLRTLRVKLGRPKRWRSYEDVRISRTDLLGNVLRAQEAEALRRRRLLAGPVDPDEWKITAPTVDAYYNPLANEVVFPAGVLQPPLFDPAADDAYNYGSTGATIGHEISHAFDTRGSRFDSRGELRDWWTAEDRRRFEATAAKLVKQFDAFEPLPGHRVNGRLTLPENMADLAGLEVAWSAYLASLSGREPPVIDGLTGAQRFFLGYAQSYRSKRRPELLIQQLATNPHAPERYRVNAVVSHLDAFHEAFGVTPKDAMWIAPEDRVSLWGAGGGGRRFDRAGEHGRRAGAVDIRPRRLGSPARHERAVPCCGSVSRVIREPG